MDNLYFKRLPSQNVPAVTGNNVVIVETSAGVLKAVDSAGEKNIADQTWANNLFLKKSDAEITYLKPQFVDAAGTYYYIGQNMSVTIGGGTHVFTECWGTVTVAGNTANIYVVNSPNLVIAGKTASNWQNIYMDGKATFTVLNAYSDGSEIGIGSTAVTLANNLPSAVDIRLQCGISGNGVRMLELKKFNNAAQDYDVDYTGGTMGVYLVFTVNGSTLTAKLATNNNNKTVAIRYIELSREA